MSRASVLAATVVVARFLQKEGFGEFAIVQSTAAMFEVFATFGLGLTATKHVAQYRQADPQKASRIITLLQYVSLLTGGIFAVTLLVLASWLANRVLAAPHLALPLRISSIWLFLAAINGTQTGILSGLEAFRRIAQVNLVSGSCSFVLTVVGVFYGGVLGAVCGLVVAMAITCMANFIALRSTIARSEFPPASGHPWQEWPILWRYSLPTLLSAFFFTPVNWICMSFLVNTRNGYSELGVFNAANQWFLAILVVPNLLSVAMFPIFSERVSANDAGALRTILRFAYLINGAVTFPIVLIASLASPWLMRAYGDEFSGEWPTLVVVLSTAALLAIQVPVGQIIAAAGKMWAGVIMSAGWALVYCTLAIVLTSHGAFGLALARLVSYMIHGTWLFAFGFLWMSANTSSRDIRALGNIVPIPLDEVRRSAIHT